MLVRLVSACCAVGAVCAAAHTASAWTVFALRGDENAGVWWAAQELSAALPGSRVVRWDGIALPPAAGPAVFTCTRRGFEQLGAEAEPAPDWGWLGEEGFQIARLPKRDDLIVLGASDAAVMYGLLELAGAARGAKSATAEGLTAALEASAPGGRSRPDLRLRGVAQNFPFWLGTTLYDGWTRAAATDHRTDWWFFDEKHWRWVFQRLARARINAFLMPHPHPYPALIRYREFPEAAYYTDEETERLITWFHWLFQEGRKYGVEFYFLTWNIHLPPGMQRAHGLPEERADTPVAREYTRYVVRELFETYPEFGGLATMAAEAPPGCVDFVLNAIVPGLNDVEPPGQPRPKPRLIYWGWCSYPEDTAKIMAAYRGETLVMHYLQYETFFWPGADPRIKMWSDALGGAPMIALGGPKGANAWLFWSDPLWMRDVVADLPRKDAVGMFLEGWQEGAKLLALPAFGRYAWRMIEGDESDYWREALAAQYGGHEAGALLEAMREASAIMPTFLWLVHSQTDHYLPQFGLPLVHYIGMSTINTYVFENHEKIDPMTGYLWPRMGLTHPNPEWGVEVMSVAEYARAVAEKHPIAVDIHTPPMIADRLERHAAACLDNLSRVRDTRALADVADGLADPEPVMRHMTLNAYLGKHYADKIRAAVAWALWKEGVGPGADVERHLAASVEWFDKVGEQAWALIPREVATWRSAIGHDPPWGHADLWRSYQRERTHWREIAKQFRRELDLVRGLLKGDAADAYLPLPAELVAAAADVEVVARFGFEDGDGKGAIIIRDPAWRLFIGGPGGDEPALSGDHSLIVDTTASEQEWHMFLRTDPTVVPLRPGETYQVTYKYRIIEPSGAHRAPFAAAARTVAGGWQKDIGTNRTWGGPKGKWGERTIVLEPRDYDDYSLFFLIRGRAALALDDIVIARVVTGG